MAFPGFCFSGGAAHDRFERVLEYAYAAGSGGFLAGRTIWLDAVRIYFPDLAAVSAALKKQSVAILNSLSELTKGRAHSWLLRFFEIRSRSPGERFRSRLSSVNLLLLRSRFKTTCSQPKTGKKAFVVG